MGFGKSAKRTYMKLKKKAYGERGVTGRYYRVGAVKGLQNLAKDVEMIKNRLNVEKKHKEMDVTTGALGQVAADAEGSVAHDITPSISQGLNQSDRVGNSIKMTGLSIPLQFSQQTKCLGDRKVRVTLVRGRAADNGVSATEARDRIWDLNPLTGVRDFNAPKSYRNVKSDGLAIVRSQVYHIKGPTLDSSSPGNLDDTEVNVTTVRMSVKLQDILRYAEDGHSSPTGVRYFLIIQADAGNSTGTTSTLDVPIQNDSSGIVYRLATRFWWVDN